MPRLTAGRSQHDINQILAREAFRASSRYGAAMGRRRRLDGEPGKLYLQRLRFVSGDYDTGGAYWGGGPNTHPMWCAFSADLQTMIFVRGVNREAAWEAVQDELPEDGYELYAYP